MVFDDSLNSKITGTVMGLAAEIEREFISIRTKETLAKHKTASVVLDRAKKLKLKLDKHSKEILKYLEKGLVKQRFVTWWSVHPVRCMSGLSVEKSPRIVDNLNAYGTAIHIPLLARIIIITSNGGEAEFVVVNNHHGLLNTEL